MTHKSNAQLSRTCHMECNTVLSYCTLTYKDSERSIKLPHLIIIAIVAACFLTCTARGDVLGKVTGLPLPRFASFKSKKSNVRIGPSNKHQVKWVYQKRSYPIKIVAEFENWRKVNDVDGQEGWAHEAMLSGTRYVLVTKNIVPSAVPYKQLPEELLLLRKPNDQGQPVARVQMGVVCLLQQCHKQFWCKVKCDGHQGWLMASNLWGILPPDMGKKFR